MKRIKGRIKLAFVVAFAVTALVLVTNNGKVTQRAEAFSAGPPPGFTGAPGEQTCTNCHFGVDTGGQFSITPPQ